MSSDERPAFTNWLFSGINHFFWGFYPEFGKLGLAFIVYALMGFLLVSGKHFFLRPRLQSSRTDRSRRRALRIGVLVANIAAVDLIAAFGWPIYPFGWFAAMCVMIGAEHAHRRHGLWRIEYALQASQILNTIEESVLVVEENFDVYFSNRAANELFDCPQSAKFSLTKATNGVLTEAIHRKILNGHSMPLLEVELSPSPSSEDTRTYVISNSIALDELGQAVGVIYVFRDTTAYTRAQQTLRSMQSNLLDVHRKARNEAENRLKQIENQLVQVAKLEALGQLAGGVAHDFNNLLTAILGGCDLALGQLQQGQTAQRALLQIRRAGEQGAKITQQLLAYSRKQPLDPHIFDVNQAVSDAAKLIRSLIPENINILVRPEAAHSHVLAEPGQLTQVLINLAINARDAMPSGGRLTICTRDFAKNKHGQFSANETLSTGKYVAISVEDTGCGMDSQTQCRIFDPFFTTKEAGKGTGLGLSTAYGTVHQLGGDMLVESAPGNGSTFQVLLPVVEQTSRLQVDTSAPTISLMDTKRRILVVEDDESVRAILAEVLSTSGHLVREASDGEEAIQILESESNRFALVLTDVIMPGVGGRELTLHIADHYPQIKTIAMSGYLGKHDMTDLKRLVSCILVKPFGRDKLLSTVQTVLFERQQRKLEVLDNSLLLNHPSSQARHLQKGR